MNCSFIASFTQIQGATHGRPGPLGIKSTQHVEQYDCHKVELNNKVLGENKLSGDDIQDVPNGRRRVGGVQPGGGQVHPAHKRQDRKLPGDLPWKGNVI